MMFISRLVRLFSGLEQHRQEVTWPVTIRYMKALYVCEDLLSMLFQERSLPDEIWLVRPPIILRFEGEDFAHIHDVLAVSSP